MTLKKNQVRFKGRVYGHRQIWQLIQALSAQGWDVVLGCLPERRSIGTPFSIVDPWQCCIFPQDARHSFSMFSRCGETPFQAVAAVVEQSVNPYLKTL